MKELKEDIKEGFNSRKHSKFAHSLITNYKIGCLKDNAFEEHLPWTAEQQEMFKIID